MPKNPLAEVFGFPIDNVSPLATRFRSQRLCPFNNKVPNCTKDKAQDPLGVCSVNDGDKIAVTCPVRFRENWIVAENAAQFFFPPNTKWTSLLEVRLQDRNGESAGNIDIVLVAYDDAGQIVDFGSVEVQAVYISGNVRDPFEHFMKNANADSAMDWTGKPNFPRPDYLSSSRKRLAPQLLFKGGIFSSWGKKQAVAIHRGFFDTLPTMRRVEPSQADLAWMVYDLNYDDQFEKFVLGRSEMVYTKFKPTLRKLTTAKTGNVEAFVQQLQTKLSQKLESAPDAPTLTDIIRMI